jgi:hypothetical protein
MPKRKYGSVRSTHKHTNIRTYKDIVEKAYKELGIKNPLQHASKLLKSGYPTQHNDYIMIRLSVYDNKKGWKKMWMPVDSKIYSLVFNLTKNGFILQGWDEGSLKFNEDAFIFVSIDKKNNNNNNNNTVNKLLKNLLLFFRNTNDIVLKKWYDEGVMINWSVNTIKTILKNLNIKISKKKSLPGGNSIRKHNKWTLKYMNKIYSKVLVPDIE